MPRTTLIRHVTVVSGGTATPDAWVRFEGDRIAAVGTSASLPPHGAADLDAANEVIDAPGCYLLPGFIDLHVHGGAGHSFDASAESISAGLAFHRRHGTTRSMISLVSADTQTMYARLSTAATVARNDPLVLGLHAEGPFLSALRRGAHDSDALRAPDPSVFARMQDSADGRLRMMTVAPELAGGIQLIETMTHAGVIAAVGHTDADADTAARAFDSGATVLTHTFNGMREILHRAPGPVLAAAARASVFLELICDGVHVAPQVMRMLTDLVGERVVLVTDAMAAAGAADGDFMLGSMAVRVRDGIARLADGSSIAGSTLTADQALRVMVTDVGVPLERAAAMLTEHPARAIGVADRLGMLRPGFAADAVLLNSALEVQRVWAAGVEIPLGPAD